MATWNFSGLGSECKQKEIGGVLDKNSIDVVAGILGKSGLENPVGIKIVQEVRVGLAF